MHEYEIGVLQQDGCAALITSEMHLRDHSAIRWARKLAAGMEVEVWRGLERIYGADGAPSPKSSPHEHLAS